MQWKLNLDPDEFFSSLDSFEYAHIVDRLCCLNTARNGLASWGEKTPGYIFELELMHQLFPESKFIYIVRDGRDTALSLMERSWGPANVYSCATYWKRCNEARPVLEALQKIGLLHQVRYEQLLDEPVASVGKLASFLGLEWPEEKLERITGKSEARITRSGRARRPRRRSGSSRTSQATLFADSGTRRLTTRHRSPR